MDYREIIQTSISALRRNLLRTCLTMVGIIIGITSVILIVSIGRGAVSFVTSELTSFGTDYFQITPGGDASGAIYGSNTLSMDDIEAIKNNTSFTNINKVVPFSTANQKAVANGVEEDVQIMGTTYEGVDILRPDIVYGEFISEQDEIGAEKVIVMGTEIAEKFFGVDTDPVGETVRIKDSNFRVIGVVHATSALAGGILNNSVYMPIKRVTSDLTGEEKIQEIDVSVKDEKQMNQTIEDVEYFLRERHDIKEGAESDFSIASATDILTMVQTITSLLTTMIAAISGISLIVGGVGVMNIMLVSVTERTKEIGLLKSIGAKEKDILTQFLIEAVVMSVAGGIIGIILGVLGAYLISGVANIPFVIDWVAIVVAVGVSTLVGVVFGLYPAKRAASLSPIDALRYE